MIDRPPTEEPSPSPIAPPVSPSAPPRRASRLGSLRVTIPVILVGLAIIGSVAYIVYVVAKVQDEQIQLLGYGFGVLGASFAAIAIGTIYGMWRAASRARTGRSFMLAIVGGIAGLLAIGCFTFTALSLLVGKG